MVWEWMLRRGKYFAVGPVLFAKSVGMKRKVKVKMCIDFLMTVLLILLMAYQVTGQELHEWFGAGMLVLFIVHNILNIQWYRNLFRGTYRLARIFGTLINFAVLAAILSLGYSGIVMSRHLFVFLPINRGMALARVMHLAGSYWGLVLMSLHLGFHWGMVTGMFRKYLSGKKLFSLTWLSRLFALAVAGFGAWCFVRADIISYLFLKNEFAFFDFEKSSFLVLTEYTAMIGLWVFVGYYVTRGIGKLTCKKRGDGS